jgi:hypothetical protein
MNVYRDLEDSLYDVVTGLFPDWTVIFALTNGPEPVNPYCVINVRKMDMIGQPYTSHLASVDISNPDQYAVTQTVQDVYATVRFEFHGLYDWDTITADMSHALEIAMRTPRGYEALAKNRLSLHKRLTSRRLPVKRETDMYMVYQLDATFAYTSVSTDDVQWIEILGVTGIYHDAGREPDHTIINHIDINTQP